MRKLTLWHFLFVQQILEVHQAPLIRPTRYVAMNFTVDEYLMDNFISRNWNHSHFLPFACLSQETVICARWIRAAVPPF